MSKELQVSEQKGSTANYIDRLVVRAIEKKKQKAQELANKNKPKLEYVLFSHFNVLDTLPSKNGRTTIYHLAQKDDPSKQMCCKIVNEDMSDEIGNLLLEEASRLEISQHPSVAEFVKVSTDFERPYLMYEWVDGESLAEKISRHTTKAFRHDHIAWLVYQLAGALEYMHTRGVCHLDIKPSNILVRSDDVVKLIDFGAARYTGDAIVHAEASLKYASPAYIETAVAQPQDDVYSLALLTCHLFIGSTYGNNWDELVTLRKRPLLIPPHVWRLLRKVIKNPRAHGLTAISFAQELARIDTHTLKSNNSAPLFSSLRNADLVLTEHKIIHDFSGGYFKYLEMGLVASIAFVVGGYLFSSDSTSKPEWTPPVKQSDLASSSKVINSIKPAQTASFLSQTPWDIENILDDMDNDVVALAPYREAYQVQQGKLYENYLNYKELIIAERNASNYLSSSVKLLKSGLITLRQDITNLGTLPLELDNSMTNLMSRMNKIEIDSQKFTHKFGAKDNDLVSLILNGKASEVGKYIKSTWANHQAESYYYSQVLPQIIMNGIYDSIHNHVQRNYYTLAIEEVDAAKQFFGNTSELMAKRNELIVARSEYILFSTVTEKSIFDSTKLLSALDDLKRVSPKTFDQLTEKLRQQAQENIESSYKKASSAKGAIAIQSALDNYNVDSRITTL